MARGRGRGASSSTRVKRERRLIDSDSDEMEEVVERPAFEPLGLNNEKITVHPDGFMTGSIVRIKVTDFLTYDNCEFPVGPRLNMVVGPNGTGKSSIVCAIVLGLGGDTKDLGRAKDLKDFVKRGKKNAQIEIELKGTNGHNVTVTRRFSSENNTSRWLLNGENSTETQVMQEMKKFRIQVNNLIQVLPQDRVSKFAEMTHEERFRETQRAVLGEESIKIHDQLKTFRAEEAALEEQIARQEQEITNEEGQNNRIAGDVELINRKEQIQQQIKYLESLLIFARYSKKFAGYNEAKAEFTELQRQVEAASSNEAPLNQAIQIQQNIIDEAKTRFSQLKTQVEKMIKENSSLNEKCQSQVHQVTSAHKRFTELAKNQAKRRKELDREVAKLKKTQDKIESLREEVDRLGVPREKDGERTMPSGPYEKIVKEIQSAIAAHSAALSEVLEVQTELDDLKRARDQTTARKNRIVQRIRELNSVQGQRLQQIASGSPDVINARQWILENSNLFQQKVFGPLLVEINVKNPKYANAVEAMMGFSLLTTFVVQNRHDYDVIHNNLMSGKQDYRINVAMAPEIEPRRPISREDILNLGFDGVVTDYVEADPAIMRHLYGQYLHLTPIAIENPNRVKPNEVDNLMRIMRLESPPIRKYVIGDVRYQVTTHYSGKSANQLGRVPHCRYFNSSVDEAALARLQGDVREVDKELEQISLQAKEVEAMVRAKNKVASDLDHRKNSLDANRLEMIKMVPTLRNLERDEAKERRLVESLQTKVDNEAGEREEEARKIKADAEKVTRDVMKLASNVQTLQDVMLQRNICMLKENQATYLRKQYEEERDRRSAHTLELRRQRDEAKQALDKLKQEAKELQEKWKTTQNHNTPEQIEQIHQDVTEHDLGHWENQLGMETTRLEAVANVPEALKTQYENRKRKIANLKIQVEEARTRLNSLRTDLQDVKRHWYARVVSMVERLNESAQPHFQRVGAAGEIRLHEAPDYKDWAIHILVKFRDNEELHLLDAQRQSGGERSVTTIVYLMSLQDQIQVPFRIVDEINQGMDPRNERLIHRQFVNVMSSPTTPQYFLITPKLLPDLTYSQNMRVLFICNGDGQPEKLNIDKVIRAKRNRARLIAAQ